jgi:acetyl esterase
MPLIIHPRLRVFRDAAIAATVLFPLSGVAQTPPAGPQPLTIDGAATHVYKTVGGHELRLHVFSEDASGADARRPAIVFFFGGGWTQGSVTQFVTQATHFARRGMVAIVADYRVSARHGTSPFEAIADAKSAVRWVRANAARLRVDPDRIVASGGSSGGHIALSTAVFDTFDEGSEDKAVSSKPNALVLFNPAVNTGDPGAERLKERFANRGRDGSPFHHLRRGLPPALIVHGKADQVVPYADVERFCAESKALGNRCELVGYDGAPHGFFNQRIAEGKWYRETLAEADRFLTEIRYLRAPGSSW